MNAPFLRRIPGTSELPVSFLAGNFGAVIYERKNNDALRFPAVQSNRRSHANHGLAEHTSNSLSLSL